MYSKQVVNPELLNAHAHDAKHVLSIATLRKYRDPSDRSKSLIISPVPLIISPVPQQTRGKMSNDIFPRFICKNPRSIYARATGDGAIWSKNRKVVPYHGDNPNTRNGVRLRSPSPIMVPDAACSQCCYALVH